MRGTIYERRRTIGDQLRRALDGEFIVVAAPDHPLVMRPVDVLVGGRSGLTAIVMPTVEEVRRPKLLQTRVTLNKLALPPEANFVYVSEPPEKIVSAGHEFAAVLSLSDPDVINELKSIAAAPRRSLRQADIITFRQLAEGRFADTYRVARIAQRWFHRPREAPSLAQGRSRRASRDRLGSGLEGAFFASLPTSGAIVDLSIEGVERWFQLAGGQPVPTNEPAGIAFAPDYPRIPGDPDKVLRASAFAGWVFAPSDPTRSLARLSELVARYARLR